MKYIVLSILTISFFICCGKDKQVEKYFDPEMIEMLDLANIEGFWDNNSQIDTTFYTGSHFVNHPSFLSGMNLFSNTKFIRVSVFTNQAMAIDAMEHRIDDVAGAILTGTNDEINGTWWHSEDGPKVVFVNQWNIIFEVGIQHYCFNEVKDILYSTANEIAKRVDELSE